MKSSVVLVSVTNKVKLFLGTLLCVLFVSGLSSCSQEDSSDLSAETPLYQDYLVAFSDNKPTMAYAHFTKKKDAIFTEIKLTGEQGIYANLKPMNYHYVNELVWVGYSYSLTLGNDTTVTFSFKRNTSKILTNMVRKSFVKRIAIPSDLKEVVNGMAWKWVGDNGSEGEKIEAILEKNTDGYSAFYGTVTEGKNDVLFESVPAGNYKLILRRYKTAELKEKDGNAGGDFAVVYYDEKQVVVK